MEPKKSRGLRLDADVNRKLEAVCKAHGTNANSYIINELGKSITRDYVAIGVQSGGDETFAALKSLMEALAVKVDENKLDEKD